jgi:hypothetical protein
MPYLLMQWTLFAERGRSVVFAAAVDTGSGSAVRGECALFVFNDMLVRCSGCVYVCVCTCVMLNTARAAGRQGPQCAHRRAPVHESTLGRNYSVGTCVCVMWCCCNVV